MSDVLTCQSEYLAADDLRGRMVTVQIAQVGLPPKMPGSGGGKPSKSVKVLFAKGSKAWICNPTNQWAMAVLFGDKAPKTWLGKRVVLIPDLDWSMEAKAECMSVRIIGSPDATPERNAAYKRAWNEGDRKNGALCRRLKRIYRLMVPMATAEAEPEPTAETEAAE